MSNDILQQGELCLFLKSHPQCRATAWNIEAIRAAMLFLGVERNQENLHAAYLTLRRLETPLDIDPTRADSVHTVSIFPRLLHLEDGWRGLAPYSPTIRAFVEKEQAAQILAEKKQQEAEAADAPAVPGTWIGDSYYVAGTPLPANAWQGAQDLVGMQRATRQAVNNAGKDFLERNTVR